MPQPTLPPPSPKPSPFPPSPPPTPPLSFTPSRPPSLPPLPQLSPPLPPLSFTPSLSYQHHCHHHPQSRSLYFTCIPRRTIYASTDPPSYAYSDAHHHHHHYHYQFVAKGSTSDRVGLWSESRSGHLKDLKIDNAWNNFQTNTLH